MFVHTSFIKVSITILPSRSTAITSLSTRHCVAQGYLNETQTGTPGHSPRTPICAIPNRDRQSSQASPGVLGSLSGMAPNALRPNPWVLRPGSPSLLGVLPS